MSRQRLFKVLLVLAVLGFTVLSFVFARNDKVESEPAPSKVADVVLFAVPNLGIDDVDPERMPVLSRLAGEGAIAATNVRTKGHRPDVLDAYATLSAGNRVAIGDPEPPAPDPVEPEAGQTTASSTTTTTTVVLDPATGEPVDAAPIEATARPIEAALIGRPETDPDMIVLREMAAIIANADAGNDPDSQPGSLATRLRRAGMRAAVVTNAGTLTMSPERHVPAPAAVAAADRYGLIDRGSVSEDLLAPDAAIPGAVTADPEAFVDAVADALDDSQLVVVDPGEMSRAAAAGDWMGGGALHEDLRVAALTRTDAVLGALEESLDPDTLLVVVGVTPPTDRWALTPMVVTGAGTPHGYLHSSSTHRPDLVTLTDLAPTVLDALAVSPPAAMIGNPLAYRPGEASWDGALALDTLLEDRAPIDRPMAIGFIVVQSVVYLLAVAALTSDRSRPAWFDRALLLAVVTCAAWPLATFWLRIAPSLYSYGAGTFVLCWVVAAAVAFAVTRLRRHVLDPVLALCILTVATLVGDLATGAHLQYGSFFGYAPTTAPRFIGIGNAAFALLGGATVVICTALVARARNRSLALWAGGAVAAVVVLADGAPWMGTDVGGILTLVPVLCLLFWALSGRRVRWHTIGFAAVAAAAVLGAAVAIESLRDPAQRTHIGRFFLQSGEGTAVQDTLSRKWSANMEVLTRSPLAWSVPIIAGVSFVAVASGRAWRRVLPLGSPERTGVTATLAMGFVGWILNDSGVVVLALASVFLGPYILLLAQARGAGADGSSPTETEPPGNVPLDMEGDHHPAAALPSDARVVALVPAKDRADSVGATVRSLLDLGTVSRVLVIDDGSDDHTADEARLAGAEVLRLPENLGKGGAVAAGVAATPDADVYLLIDADVGTYASEASHLLEPVQRNDADLVIGVLPSPGTKGGFGNVRRFSRWGIQRACGLITRAPLSGQRAIRAEHLRGLEASGRFGLEVAMTIEAVRAGARVVEVDVAMEHRHTGRSVSGFRHRGTQGLDIAAALWPRLTSPRLRHGAVALLVVLALVASYFTATSAAPESRPLGEGVERVVVFGIPGLSIDDVSEHTTPNLHRLSDEGALGLATPRTAGSLTPVAVYASLGAGDRVRAGRAAGLAVDAQTPLEGDPAAVVVTRRSGPPGSGEVVVPSIAATIRAAGSGVTSHPGALGEALHGAGLRTAVVANSATVDEAGEQEASAPAALAVVDAAGGIDHGEVGPGLLHAAPGSPFGVEADAEAFAAAVDAVLAEADVTVVDPGEMDRFRSYRHLVAEDRVAEQRAGALARTDDVLGRIAADLPEGTLLIVTGITPATGGELVPTVMHGDAVTAGRITSGSTRRADLVTITDLAPTILSALGVQVPAEMIGQPVRQQPGSPDRGDLADQERLIADRDEVYGPLHHTFVLAAIAFYALAAAVVLRVRRLAPLSPLLRFAALTTMAWPISGFVLRAVPSTYGWGALSHALVWVVAALLAAVASTFRARKLDPLLVVALVTWAVIVADVATGARLQVSSYLGYTPAVAARFVGLGNAAFGILAGATVVSCALVVARSDRPRDAWWVAAAIALIAVVADGAPWMGSDVGGILSLVPAVGVLLLLLSGRRLSWKTAVAFLAAAVVLLAVSVAFEASRPLEQRTHIGRFFLGEGGDDSFATTISRKWSVNVRLLVNSRWSWLIPGLGAFVAVVLGAGRRWVTLLRGRPAARAGLLALGTAAFLGWATNDSGPLVAALVLVYTAPLVLFLALRGPRPEAELLAPLDGPDLTAARRHDAVPGVAT